MSFRILSCVGAVVGRALFHVPRHLHVGWALLAAFALFHFSAPASAQTATEQACAEAIQGKVAWDQAGSTTWDPTNVNNLCRGAVDYQARIACFTAGIANHNDWSRAISDCQTGGASAAAPGAPAAAPSAASGGFVPVTNSAVRIESSQDRSRAVNVLNSENPVASNFPADQPSTQWIIVPAQESPFYRLSSAVRPNLFLNNEGGILTTSLIKDGWWSAQWTFESSDGQNWRVCNRWTGECLRLLNGNLALAAASPGEPDALWAIPGAAAPQAGGTLTPVAAPDPEPAPETVVLSAETPSEQACFDAVQGKVAYNRNGAKSWDPANIKNLCKGAVDPQARIACFSAQIQKVDDWSKAIDECKNLVVGSPDKEGEVTIEDANTLTVSFANTWNTAIVLTAERDASAPTADVASPAWVSADWVLEPAPAHFGPHAYYIRNKWRNTYLTYVDEHNWGNGGSNIQLLPKKRSDTNDRDEVLLAQGQTWIVEPVDNGGKKVVRIRTAHTGFGLVYLTIVAQGEGTHSGGLPFLSFMQPYGGMRVGDLAGSKWIMYSSSHVEQQQCVRNLSLTAFDAEWYNARNASYSLLNDNSLIIRPDGRSKPVLTERTIFNSQSCENQNERMIAVIKPVGAAQLNQFLALATVQAGGVAGFFGANALGISLDKKSLSIVYMGVPGKISIGGTLYDAKTTVDEPLKH